MSRVLVLGAGFGGLTAATELARLAPRGTEVTLIDRRERFLMGLAKLQILDGRRTEGEGARRIADVERHHGVRVVRGEAQSVDVAAKRVVVSGEVLAYDHLVLALGAECPAPAAGRNLYDAGGVAELHADLASVESGDDVLIAVTSVPFKCPPAPYEAGMLAATFLASRDVDASVTVASPEPQPLPVAGPECGGMVREWAEERGVDVLSNHAITGAEGGVARFANGATREYDALAVVPAHRAPQVLRDAGLLGEAGWIPVDAATLATRHPDVWAVGDCTIVKLPGGKPLVKAGVMAEGEAKVVAENLASRLRGEPERARFAGTGGCFLEVGRGEAVEIAGDFYATPSPVVASTGPPSARALAAKHAFERERLERWFGPA